MKSDNKGLVQAIKFTLFSISAGVIQALSFAAFNELPNIIFGVSLGYWACYLPSLVLSVLWNFTFNRKFTFKSAVNVNVAMLKVAGYYIVFTPLSTYLGHLATVKFNIGEGSVGEYIVLGVTMLVNFVTEFLFDKYFVFNDSVKNEAKVDK